MRRRAPCPVWVRLGSESQSASCPLSPWKRTSLRAQVTSAWCQERTSTVRPSIHYGKKCRERPRAPFRNTDLLRHVSPVSPRADPSRGWMSRHLEPLPSINNVGPIHDCDVPFGTDRKPLWPVADDHPVNNARRFGFEVDDTDRIYAAIGRGGSSQVGRERNLRIGT